MSDIFGQSNYGGNYTKKKYFKLKDGEAAYRILPALGDLAAEGRWSVFWKVHYGYKNSKGQLRVFESPLVKNSKSKMIERPDAALERIEKLKAEFEKAKKEGNVQMIAQLDKLVGQKGAFNLDSNHYMNVIDESGQIGILKIRHRAKVALDAEIKRLREAGIDPLSPTNGRYFVFRRSGTGLDTTFSVSVKKEKVNVPGMGELERDLVHVLTPEIAGRCATRQTDGTVRYVEAANLVTLYKKPTSEEVARIVREGAKAVDEILDSRSGNDDSGDEDYGDEDNSASSAPAAQQAAAQAVPAVATQATPAAQATPAVIQQAPASAPTPLAQAAPVQAPAQPVQAAAPQAEVATQSDEDFLKSLGL